MNIKATEQVAIRISSLYVTQKYSSYKSGITVPKLTGSVFCARHGTTLGNKFFSSTIPSALLLIRSRSATFRPYPRDY